MPLGAGPMRDYLAVLSLIRAPRLSWNFGEPGSYCRLALAEPSDVRSRHVGLLGRLGSRRILWPKEALPSASGSRCTTILKQIEWRVYKE